MTVGLDELGAIGFDLAQPECVIASLDGSVHVSGGRGGVTEIRANGTQTTLSANSADLSGKLSPARIFLDQDGSYLIAHLSITEEASSSSDATAAHPICSGSRRRRAAANELRLPRSSRQGVDHGQHPQRPAQRGLQAVGLDRLHRPRIARKATEKS